ncbi:MAG: ceramidase [Candidatus Doudnabacteria bacterium]|nr:ceramidase [Candidatus Doudnabacteria bacterium]
MNLLGKPTVEFCEKAGNGIIKRPFYALSNLAYILTGLIILSKKTRYSKAFGYTAITIGLLSFAYDASYTYLSQLLDLVGMLVFVNLLIYLSVKRLFNIRTTKIILIQLALVTLGLFAIIFFQSFSGEFVFGIFISFLILLEFLLWRANKTENIVLWMTGLGMFLLGFIIWLPDAIGLWCDPKNIINGRSLFHVLTSSTIYLLYRYYELQKEDHNF